MIVLTALSGLAYEDQEVGPIEFLIEPLSFENNILPLMLRRCYPCHTSPRMGLPVLVEYETAFLKKDLILKRVVIEKTMPPGAPLSDEERALMQLWIDTGAQP